MTPLPIAPAAAAGAAPAVAAPRATFEAALRARAATAPHGAAPTPHPARAALASVERARERLDAVLAAARRGRTFTAQELLALQADAYRYSQTVEVASRVVEHGAQAVKQAVNTQV
jgi:hypothetical protein